MASQKMLNDEKNAKKPKATSTLEQRRNETKTSSGKKKAPSTLEARRAATGASSADYIPPEGELDALAIDPSGVPMPDMAYAPTEDYGSIAADRVNSAARGQFDAIAAARMKALRDYQNAMKSIQYQRNENIGSTEAKNEELRARLNNVMASRGITRGDGAAVNLAGMDARTMGAIAAINRDFGNNYKALEQQQMDREWALAQQELALREGLPTKIEELRMALEQQDFQRWSAMKNMELQAAGLASSEAARQEQYQQALTMFGLQQDAADKQFQRGLDYEQQQMFDATKQKVSSQVWSMAKKGSSWDEIKSYIHSIQDPTGVLNNVDTYLSAIGSDTEAGGYLSQYKGSPFYSGGGNEWWSKPIQTQLPKAGIPWWLGMGLPWASGTGI